MSEYNAPLELQIELHQRRSQAAKAFVLGDWDVASKRLETTYKFLLDAQEQFNKRIHKGWELHNWGIALLNVPLVDAAQDKILLAFVEDALSAAPGQEDSIDAAPAARTLAGLAFPTRLLSEIKSRALGLKETGQPIPRDPMQLLQFEPSIEEDALVGPADTITATLPAKRSLNSFQQPIERRCFVGGNYFAAGPNLNEMRAAVEALNFDPVLALDFDFTRETTHHRSLLLLHLCSKAIFEVSSPAGQLMELERCRDYDITPLLVRQVIGQPDSEVGLVSEMIASLAGVEVKLYTTIDELRRLIETYLSA